ncbi:outer membrane protein assembly factor BamB family protein [Actinoplanes aureus]|uniref:PQQ-binding-like beta-propeller repeat protein n=1 Tax=Actinoplanes aureus TaxID=2792083 RepID=A0A931G2F3_9ACTN|nr:PQQ-binding-like beta-propeller repeat protein [Actinoplanes aureus]MBG0568110.1 PQQ-binding-like beta-propeller repeat protein [Actinoplanes aureus]
MLIDLDTTPPSRPGSRPVPWRRAGLILAVSLMLLLGSSGAAATGYGLLRAAATTEGRASSWLLAGDLLVSAHVAAESSANVELRAHSLDGNGVVWSRWIDGGGDTPVLVEHGPHLAVTSRGTLVILLDLRTGQPRWEPEGYQFATLAGDQIVIWEGDRLGLFDPLGTGRIAWWSPFEAPVFAAATTGRYLVVMDEAGNAFAYVRRTGETVGRLEAGDDPVLSVTVRDSTVYVLGQSRVTALAVPGLDVRWTAPVAVPMHLTGCGTRLCVSSRSGMIAIDPATGAVRWSSARWVAWVDGLVATADGGVVQLDPETGQVRAEVGPGFPLGDLMVRGTGTPPGWSTGGPAGSAG